MNPRPRHALLDRQLRKFFPQGTSERAVVFIEAVDLAYQQFDDDRRMLERTLELSSQELMQANQEMRALFEAVPDLFFRIGAEGRVIDVRAGTEANFPVPPATLIGKSIEAIPLGEVTERFASTVRAVASSRVMTTLEYAMAGGEGDPCWYEARIVPVRTGTDVVVVIRDITVRRRAEEELKRSISLLQSTFESTADGILVADGRGRMVSFNQRFAQMWQIPLPILAAGDDDQAISHAVSQLKNPDQFLGKVRDLYADPLAESFDVIELLDGRVFERYSIPQRVDDVAVGRVWSFRDVSARKRAEERLLHDAIHDALTGLPNRTLFMDRLEHAILRSKRQLKVTFALLFVDLDRFKVVNDSLGHLAGDEVLVAIGERVRGCIRPADTVARLGGDEFTILLDEIEAEDDAVRAAERVQSVCGAPLTVRGTEIFTTVSIGIAIYAPHYTRPEELLRDADIAMYRAKAKGRAGHEVFHPGMHTTAVALLQLESDLRRALDREELLLLYQPIVSLTDERILGFEALIRWDHPARGLIYPEEFLPLAEETGLIIPMGRWTISHACSRMRQWQQLFGRSDLELSVNVSSRQLTHPTFISDVEQILGETGLPPATLCVELTETVLMENNQAARQTLARLRALGVKVHIDDFGTGYSSLSYLHRFPIDTLKIDRSFISHIETGDENLEIVRTIVTLADNLKIDVIAEGVETEAQRTQLLLLGCRVAQGRLFSMPADESAAQTMIGAGHWSGKAASLPTVPPSPVH